MMAVIDGAYAEWAFILVGNGTEEEVEKYIDSYKAKAATGRIALAMCLSTSFVEITAGRHRLPGGSPPALGQRQEVKADALTPSMSRTTTRASRSARAGQRQAEHMEEAPLGRPRQ